MYVSLLRESRKKIKQMKNHDDNLHCRVHNYKSKLQGQQGRDDEAAKKSLTTYAYKELFQTAFRHSLYLTSEIQDDGPVKV